MRACPQNKWCINDNILTYDNGMYIDMVCVVGTDAPAFHLTYSAYKGLRELIEEAPQLKQRIKELESEVETLRSSPRLLTLKQPEKKETVLVHEVQKGDTLHQGRSYSRIVEIHDLIDPWVRVLVDDEGYQYEYTDVTVPVVITRLKDTPYDAYGSTERMDTEV